MMFTPKALFSFGVRVPAHAAPVGIVDFITVTGSRSSSTGSAREPPAHFEVRNPGDGSAQGTARGLRSEVLLQRQVPHQTPHPCALAAAVVDAADPEA